MNGIRVEILSGGSGVYLLPESAIRQVTAPDSSTSDCDPSSEFYDIYACPWYDNGSQTYFQLSTAYASADGDAPEDLYRPNYMVAATDNRAPWNRQQRPLALHLQCLRCWNLFSEQEL